MAKERAMLKRKLRKYLERLEMLKKSRSREIFMQRLGKLKHHAGSSHKCVTLTIPKNKSRIEVREFDYKI